METLNRFRGFNKRHLPRDHSEVSEKSRGKMRDPTILPFGGQGCEGRRRPLARQDPACYLSNLMSSTAPLKLTIISRKDCHLCDVVYRIASHLQTDFPIEITKVSAEADPTLLARYGEKVPVVLVDGIERCAGKITEGDLRRAIKRARWRRPISRILSRLGYAPGRG